MADHAMVIHWITDHRPTAADGFTSTGLVQLLTPDGVIDTCSVRVAAMVPPYMTRPWAHCPGWHQEQQQLAADFRGRVASLAAGDG